MSDYPQHEKLMEQQKEHQALIGFLDFLRYEKDIHGLVQAGHLDEGTGNGKVPYWSLTDRLCASLMAEYLEVDEAELEAEKVRMLRSLSGDA